MSNLSLLHNLNYVDQGWKSFTSRVNTKVIKKFFKENLIQKEIFGDFLMFLPNVEWTFDREAHEFAYILYELFFDLGPELLAEQITVRRVLKANISI